MAACGDAAADGQLAERKQVFIIPTQGIGASIEWKRGGILPLAPCYTGGDGSGFSTKNNNS
jgi:hypothetical protein